MELQPNPQNCRKPVNMYSKTIKVLKGKKIKSKETDHRVFFFFFFKSDCFVVFASLEKTSYREMKSFNRSVQYWSKQLNFLFANTSKSDVKNFSC